MDKPLQEQQAQQLPNRQSSYTMPGQLQEATQNMASLTKLLTEVSNSLIALRREFRGEALWQSDDGENHWVQISKPSFVRIDLKTRKPITKIEMMPWGEEKIVYEPNDEAIDEVLSMLKFAGVNQISPIGTNDFNNLMDDLREFECKLAAVLMLKQKEWGLDKELLPMIQFKIKTIVQDVRSMSLNGGTLKALQTTVQRVESLIEGDGSKRKLASSPFGQ